MSLLFIEGFGAGSLQNKWNSATINGIYTTSPRIPGGSRAQINGTDSLRKTFSASSKLVTGYGYFRHTSQGHYTYIAFMSDNASTYHITILHNSAGYIEIRIGDRGGVLATSTSPVPAGVWTYLEVSVTVSDTVGEVHVRRDGANTDLVSYTGDTRNGGTSTNIDSVIFSTYVETVSYTDIYILNDTGTTNNDFLGDVAVATLRPNGNGNSTMLTGSDGNQVDNYLLVDETPFSATDYTQSDTAGDKDTYTLQNLPATASTVYAVQVHVNMQKDDAGAAQARSILRSGSTDYPGTTQTLSTTPLNFVDLYNQDPATSNEWTTTDVDALEAGMEVV